VQRVIRVFAAHPRIEQVAQSWHNDPYDPAFLENVVKSYQEHFPWFVSKADLADPSQETVRKIHQTIREFFKLCDLPAIDQACRFNSYDPHEIRCARTKIEPLLRTGDPFLREALVKAAASVGQTHMVDALIGHTKIVEAVGGFPSEFSVELQGVAVEAAAKAGRAEVVGRFVVKHFDDEGIPILYLVRIECTTAKSAREGHTEIVKILIGACPALSQRLREIAFAEAVSAGQTALVRNLLDGGEISEESLEIAVRLGAEQGNTELVHLLIHSRPGLSDQLRGRAFEAAVVAGETALARNLLDGGEISEVSLDTLLGAVGYWAGRGHTELVHLLIHSRPALSAQLRGRAFEAAVVAGETALVRNLLADGEIPEESLGLYTALRAVGYWAGRGHTELVHLLIHSRPALSAQLRGKALEAAAEAGQRDLVRFLLDHGPIQYGDRVRALEAAIARGDPTIVEILRARQGGCAGLYNRLWSSGPQIAAAIVGALAATTAIFAAQQN
jgi:ankyrin repeat protein